MTRVPLMRSTGLRPFEPFLWRSGVAAERLLEQAGIPMRCLEEDDLVMPQRPLWRLLSLLREKEAADAGFRAIEESHFQSHPVVQPYLKKPNLLGLLQGFIESRRCISNYPHDYFLREKGKRVLYCRQPPPIDRGQWPIEQCAVWGMIALVRRAAGDNWTPRGIGLQYSEPLLPEEQAWIAGSNIHQGTKYTWISIDRELLSRPILKLHTTDAALSELSEPDSARDFLDTCLPVYLGQNLTLESFCRHAGIAPRTLQYRLNQEGTTFQEALDSVRRQYAIELMETGEFLDKDIAGNLGYASPAAFSRAFRRWTGFSPANFRKIGFGVQASN